MVAALHTPHPAVEFPTESGDRDAGEAVVSEFDGHIRLHDVIVRTVDNRHAIEQMDSRWIVTVAVVIIIVAPRRRPFPAVLLFGPISMDIAQSRPPPRDDPYTATTAAELAGMRCGRGGRVDDSPDRRKTTMSCVYFELAKFFFDLPDPKIWRQWQGGQGGQNALDDAEPAGLDGNIQGNTLISKFGLIHGFLAEWMPANRGDSVGYIAAGIVIVISHYSILAQTPLLPAADVAPVEVV